MKGLLFIIIVIFFIIFFGELERDFKEKCEKLEGVVIQGRGTERYCVTQGSVKEIQ